jgi:hypothetical protein
MRGEERVMQTTLKALLIGVVLLLGGAGAAWVTDVCYEDASAVVYVFKSFTIPGPDACKLINGYLANTNCLLHGNACGTADNLHILFQGAGCTFTFNGTTSRSTNSGSITLCGPGCIGAHSFSKIPCPVSRPLID